MSHLPLHLLFVFAALPLAAQAQSFDTLQAKTLLAEGRTLVDAGHFEEGLEKIKYATRLALPPSGEENPVYAGAIHMYGYAFSSNKQWDSAIVYFERALDIRARLFGREHFETTKTLNNLGLCYCSKANQPDAETGIGYLEETIRVRGQLFPGDSTTLVNPFTNLVLCHRVTGNFRKAKTCAETVFRLLLQANDGDKLHGMLASSLNNLGVLHSDFGRYDTALVYYREALSIRYQLYPEPHLEQAETHNNLGVFFIEIGQYDSAIHHLQLALDIQNALLDPDHAEIAKSWLNLATAYHQKGDLNKGFYANFKVLDMLSRNHNTEMLGEINQNLGTGYLDEKDYARAEKFLREGMTIRQQLSKTNPKTAWSKNSLALCKRYQGYVSEAIELHQEAIRIALENWGETHPVAASLFYDLANTHGTGGDFGQAVEWHQKALEIRQRTLPPAHPDIAASETEIGHWLGKKGDADAAERWLLKAQQTLGYSASYQYAEVTEMPRLVANMDYLSGHYRAAYGGNEQRLRQAYETARQGLGALHFVYENMLFAPASLFESMGLRSLAFHTVGTCENGIAAAYLLHQKTGDGQWLVAALELAEQAKVISLRQAMREVELLESPVFPKAMTVRERQLRERFSLLEKQRIYLLHKAGLTANDAEMASLTAQLFQIKQDLKNLRDSMAVICPSCFGQKLAQSVASREQIAEQLEPDETLLDYFVGDSSIWLFVLQPGRLACFQIPELQLADSLSRQMVEAIGAYANRQHMDYSALEENARFLTEASQKLYALLIQPVEHLMGEKVLVSPDGFLFHLPFEALMSRMGVKYSDFQQHGWLLRKYQFNYMQSASMWVSFRQRSVSGKKMSGTALVMAPFVLDGALTNSPRSGDFSLLGHSGNEARFVGAKTGGNVLLREEATLENFVRLAGGYPVLHLCTHGASSAQVGDYSYLAFYGAETEGGQAKLFVRDIYSLKLQAEMVVLSACQTGQGEIRPGEGLIGLSGAFIFAGAKSLFVTLWPVDDPATTQLVISFYDNLFQNKTPKHQALRNAKMGLLENAATAHPYFWAGMVGIGDMRRLP